MLGIQILKAFECIPHNKNDLHHRHFVNKKDLAVECMLVRLPVNIDFEFVCTTNKKMYTKLAS